MSRDVVLVIDQDREFADDTAWNILPMLGYEAMVAYTGEAALEIVRRHHQRITVLLIDLKLPDMSGIQLLHQLRNEKFQIPVIVLESKQSRRVTIDAFRLGVQDYLTKPLDNEKLRIAISRALSELHLKREMKTLTTKLREQADWLSTILNVSKTIETTPDTDQVLRSILESSVHLTKADQGFLAIINEDQRELFIHLMINIPEEVGKSYRFSIDNPLIQEALKNQRPIRAHRSKGDMPFFEIEAGAGVYSFIHAPLFAGGKALGILSINNHASDQKFAAKDETLLTTLADYAAVTVQNENLTQKAEQEIAERERLQTALEENKKRLERTLPGVVDGSWNWDLNANPIFYSPAWKEILGFADHEISDSPDEWFKRIHPDFIAKVKLDIAVHVEGQKPQFVSEHQILHADGSYRWVLSRGVAERDEDNIAQIITGYLADITELKEAEEKLYQDAFFDPLTELPNRLLFTETLNHAVERAKAVEGLRFALLYIDLDEFKVVLENCGKHVGNRVLVEVAHMLQDGLRPTDLIAHLDGDDFVILLNDIGSQENAMGVAAWIQEQLYSPFNIHDIEILISVSVGVVMNGAYHNAAEMIRDANIAMLSAKEEGGGQSVAFHPALRAPIVRSVSLESDFQAALEENKLEVYYLPVVSLTDHQILGFEALVRWPHPDYGLLRPGEFISIAEDAELIADLDSWVLRAACIQMRKWQLQYQMPANISVSVNVSPKNVLCSDLYDNIFEVIQETSLDPGNLRIEITEDAIIEDEACVFRLFSKLASLGVHIILDDFGINYASVGKYSNSPIAALKIDKDYVTRMMEVGGHLEFVQAILTLAENLGAKSIAEGIETQEQFDILREFECDMGQGFYISEPLDAAGVEAMLVEMKNNMVMMNL